MAIWLQCASVALILFLGACQGCKVRRNSSPTIRCPTVNFNQYNDPGQSTATVTWSDPVAYDREDGFNVRVTRIGLPSGTAFNDRVIHTVKYIVRDSRGSMASCHFQFLVIVLRCAYLNIPDPINGRSSCTGNRYGDVCRYSCNPGYTLKGSDVSRCNIFQVWDNAVPQCKIKTCGALPKPSNTLTPPFVCDKGYNYGSVCLLNCDQSRGFIPTQGLTTRCTATGSWSTATFYCKDIEAPEFTNCPTQTIHQIAESGSTKTSVVWPQITAVDNSNQLQSITTSTGATLIGGQFEDGTHIVRFDVKDGAGNMAEPCTFIVKIEGVECDPPDFQGEYIRTPQCIPPFEEGKNCKVECRLSIYLNGSDIITCRRLNDNTAVGFWDWGQNDRSPKHKPFCQVKPCGALPTPPNTLTPPFVCDKGYNYDSVCLLNCDQSQGFIPTQGLTTRCTATGSWSTTEFYCKDIEAPEFTNCPTQTIHQIAESGSTKTSVVWPQITAVDNSNQLQSITTSTGATLIGGQFEDGAHIVRFDVKDGAGNMAEPCIFIVKIEGVECDPPDFQGEYIRTPQCIPPFEEGESCQVECRLSIKLNGSDFITCKRSSDDNTAVGYWDWGQNDQPPKHKPFCQVATCPNLTVPEHGALTCDEWSGGETCSILCKAGYDVVGDSAPIAFKPNYICLRNRGEWDQTYIPECSQPFFGDEVTMEAAYIFNGPLCAAAQEEIKRKFIEMMQSKGLCTDPNCKVENVEVVCGSRRKRAIDAITGRQRRRASFSFVKFTLSKKNEINPSLTAKQITDKTVSSLDQAMLDVKQKGTFVVSGNVIKAASLRKRPPIPVCQIGYVRGRNSRTLCVACPRGMFYNTEKLCQVCPIGQYQDVAGSSKCKTCPVAQSTLSVGSTSSTQCLATCAPGHWSKTGLMPCVACSRGTYKSTQGSGQCTSCPAGTTTTNKGTDSPSMCTPYDMMLQGPVMVNASVMASNDTCTMTFSVWAKLIADKGQGLRFEIYRQQEGVSFSLDLKRQRALAKDSSSAQSTASNLIVFVDDDGWTHIAVVVTTEASTVYKNGKQYLSLARGSGSCPIYQQSTLTVNVSKSTDVFLRDLNVISSSDSTTVTSLSTSCSSNMRTSIFSLQHLNMRTMDRVLKVTPSSCQKTAPDHCKNNQCAKGSTCIADLKTGMYSCVCPPDVIGKLCDERIVDGKWSKWSEWVECSKSCSKGVSTRERVCEGPKGTHKPCQGNSVQTRDCQLRSCPVCSTDDLKLGKAAMIQSCSGNSKTLNCTIKCEEGHVYKETLVEYSCVNGDWTPDRFTQSCTAPITPVSVGIKYCVVYTNDYDITYVLHHLQQIGNNFACVKLQQCRFSITVNQCDVNTPACVQHEGKIIGCLTLTKSVQAGPLDISTLQISGFILPLLDTSEVFRHESTETFSPANRPLDLAVNGSRVLVYPHSHRDQAITVTGKFGQILSVWNDLDMANWEIRRKGYVDFNILIPGHGKRSLPGHEVPYLVAQQALECPERTVSGGLFCVKCAPGTYFFESTCQPCAQGFYQDDEGQLECKPCPGATSTSILGASTISMCSDIRMEYS